MRAYSSSGPTSAGPGAAPSAPGPGAGAYTHAYPPPPPPYAQGPNGSQSQNQPPPPAGQQGQARHYQLSTPPQQHTHAGGGYAYPPLPPQHQGAPAPQGAAESHGAWAPGQGYAVSGAPWGSAPMVHQQPPPTHAQQQQEAYGVGYSRGVQLAPLRAVSPPPSVGAGGERGISKKNPLSIGNIISEDTG